MLINRPSTGVILGYLYFFQGWLAIYFRINTKVILSTARVEHLLNITANMKKLILLLIGVSLSLNVQANQCIGFYKKSLSNVFTVAASTWARLSPAEKIAYRHKHMLSMDPAGKAIERRPKILTTGDRKDAAANMDPQDVRIDTADPSLVMPITYPNGVTKYRINFSGHRYIEADTVEELYRGGAKKVLRARGFYKDGTEMVGPYHNASWPWDVVIYRNEANENIALGGAMVQAEPGKLPNVAEHNKTRSRWWGKVQHVEIAPGQYEERIIWQEPVHDFNKSPAHTGWEYHGYGGTLLTKFNAKKGIHEPVKNERGNYTLFYERVLEEKRDGDYARPWITTQFAREMDPSLKFTVGPEVMVTDITSPITGKYYEATRRGTAEHVEGYLAEGGNVLIERKHGAMLKAWSGNDYVRRYGIFLDYLPKGQQIKGSFIPVMDEKGEMVDFAAKLNLRKLLNATWVGRPQMEYDPTGQLWLRFHFVDIKTIPKGGPIEGWPSAEQFPEYARTSAQIPVKITYDQNGKPSIELDIHPEFRFMYNLNEGEGK